MEKFTILEGVPALLPDPNVSTDAIIPSVWAIKPGVDLGEKLFADWRYDGSGEERPDFVLNLPPFRTASILIAGANFGCGSSREAAVWALRRFGIRCVVAESFGEIFQENMYKNGMLPIVLAGESLRRLSDFAQRNVGAAIGVDLISSVVSIAPDGAIPFAIPDARRTMLIEGLDDFDLVMRLSTGIAAFENNAIEKRPWIYLLPR